MKYSIKLLLVKHRPNKKKELPIYIRMTISGKASFIATGRYVNPKYWDEKKEIVKPGFQNAGLINAEITARRQEIISKVVNVQVQGKQITASELKARSVAGDLTNVFTFAEAFSKEVASKRKPSTLENYRKHMLRLELFHGSRALCFEEITGEYLARYENHLHGDGDGVGSNYVHALFKTLKMFFNAAKRKGLITCYPFDTYENPVYEAPDKDYLTMQELERWETYADQVQDPSLKQTATYFLLGCYSGLRISDWKKVGPGQVEGGKIRLRATKNGEWVEMPISKPLARTLSRMRELPLLIEEPTINEKIKLIAKDKSVAIKKHLTSHSGRHTFAVTICLGHGISSETAAELMGITLATFVNNYSQVTREKINKEAAAAWVGLE